MPSDCATSDAPTTNGQLLWLWWRAICFRGGIDARVRNDVNSGHRWLHSQLAVLHDSCDSRTLSLAGSQIWRVMMVSLFLGRYGKWCCCGVYGITNCPTTPTVDVSTHSITCFKVLFCCTSESSSLLEFSRLTRHTYIFSQMALSVFAFPGKHNTIPRCAIHLQIRVERSDRMAPDWSVCHRCFW